LNQPWAIVFSIPPTGAAYEQITEMSYPFRAADLSHDLLGDRRRQNPAVFSVATGNQWFLGGPTRSGVKTQRVDNTVCSLLRHQPVGGQLPAGNIPPPAHRHGNVVSPGNIGRIPPTILHQWPQTGPRSNDVRCVKVGIRKPPIYHPKNVLTVLRFTTEAFINIGHIGIRGA